MKTVQIAKLIVEDNAYDTALNIVAHSTNKQAVKLSKEFLKFQGESEELTGDCDNPFNPDVHNYIEEEENYFKKLFTHLTK
jgi:hypothetical protein